MKIQPFEAWIPQPDQIGDFHYYVANIKDDFPSLPTTRLFKRQEAAFYVYAISDGQSTRTGLLCTVSVEEYLQERVKRHENTLVPREEKQAELIREFGAAIKPVLLAHRPNTELAEELEAIKATAAPVIAYTSPNDERHAFWKVQDPEILNRWAQMVRQHVQYAYIADGHHRFSAMARLYQRALEEEGPNPYAYVMCALFPNNNLDILNFNRVVRAFSDALTPLGFMARLSHYATLQPLAAATPPADIHEITFCIGNEWFKMAWKQNVLNEYASAGLPVTDVAMFNYCILEEILGMDNIRNDKRISYLEGPQGPEGLQNAISDSPNSVGFCLHPLQWDAFFRVIDHGLVLPPKSTWFEPRMINGLVVQPLE